MDITPNAEFTDRQACERKLLLKLLEVWEIYREYNPKGTYLSVALSDDCVSVNSDYWELDKNLKIDASYSYEDDYFLSIPTEEGDDGALCEMKS